MCDLIKYTYTKAPSKKADRRKHKSTYTNRQTIEVPDVLWDDDGPISDDILAGKRPSAGSEITEIKKYFITSYVHN